MNKNPNKNKLVSVLLFITIISLFLFVLENFQSVNNKIFSYINHYDPLKLNLSDFREANANSNTIIWKDSNNIFPIIAYNIPDNTSNLEASLKIIENGGINILINGNFGWMPDPLLLRRAFKNLKHSNLKWMAIVENECKDDFIFSNSNNLTNRNITKYLREFNDDFIYGWYLWDEPGKNRVLCSPFNLMPNDDFDDINRMVKQIRENPQFNSKLDFVNLFPTYWEWTPDKESYEKYIDAFFASQEYKPRVLCFDHYPFLKPEKGGFRNDYYLNLEIIRKKSLQYNVPFWMIVLSSGHDNYKNLTFEDIRFQVYSALAYGAKGIGYYLYSRSFEKLGYRSWILENFVDDISAADSLHGQLYAPVKKLNVEIQKLGGILLNLKSKRILHTSNFPNNQLYIKTGLTQIGDKNSIIKSVFPIDSSLDQCHLLIGEFTEDSLNGTSNYFLIVNKDFNRSIEVKIELSKQSNISRFDKTLGKFNKIGYNHLLNIKILAGDGELFQMN